MPQFQGEQGPDEAEGVGGRAQPVPPRLDETLKLPSIRPTAHPHFSILPQTVAPGKPSPPRQQQPRKPAPQTVNRANTPSPHPTPVPTSSHILVAKDALEEILATFALALTSLLHLNPEQKALQVIAKATVREHFPYLTPPPPLLPILSSLLLNLSSLLRPKHQRHVQSTPPAKSQTEAVPPSHPRSPRLTPATPAT